MLFDVPEILAVGSLAVGVVKLYLDSRKTNRDLKLAKDAITIFRDLVSTYHEQIKVLRDSISAQVDIERQKILAKQEQLSWQKLKDLGKAASWFLDIEE